MSYTLQDDRRNLTRDMRITQGGHDMKGTEITLVSVTQKFLAEPITMESMEKKYKQMNMTETATKKKQETVKPPKKSKRQEEKAIFYDIFVKPKENKIKEIIEKRNQKLGIVAVTGDEEEKIQTPYISNKLSENGKILGMNNATQTQSKFDFKKFTSTSLNLTNKDNFTTSKTQFKHNNEDIMKINLTSYLKSETEMNDIRILNNFLHEKYILHTNSSEESKKNYFNQLIQIRPPEGINAVVASPLMDSKGWAPSIPSVNIDKLNTNLKDLMTRAKGGIKAGDTTKEAHMAFYLGIMNEEEKKYETALKFYKKYFLGAKALQDIYGTELALNRIAVLFSNIHDYEQSIYYNEKHKEITTHNLNGFVAYYNCGVCYRISGRFDESIKNFDTALKMSEDENDLESYTLCFAQLAISHIFLGNANTFWDYSDEFFKKNNSLGHLEMELEMRMLNGFIWNFCNKYDTAREFYENALEKAKEIESEKAKAVALCNLGVIEAEKDYEEYLNGLEEGVYGKEEEEDEGEMDEGDEENNGDDGREVEYDEESDRRDENEMDGQQDYAEGEEEKEIQDMQGEEGDMQGEEGEEGDMQGEEGEMQGEEMRTEENYVDNTQKEEVDDIVVKTMKEGVTLTENEENNQVASEGNEMQSNEEINREEEYQGTNEEQTEQQGEEMEAQQQEQEEGEEQVERSKTHSAVDNDIQGEAPPEEGDEEMYPEGEQQHQQTENEENNEIEGEITGNQGEEVEQGEEGEAEQEQVEGEQEGEEQGEEMQVSGEGEEQVQMSGEGEEMQISGEGEEQMPSGEGEEMISGEGEEQMKMQSGEGEEMQMQSGEGEEMQMQSGEGDEMISGEEMQMQSGEGEEEMISGEGEEMQVSGEGEYVQENGTSGYDEQMNGSNENNYQEGTNENQEEEEGNEEMNYEEPPES